METRISNVVITRDGGYDCWDTTIRARDIAKAFTGGLISVDPDHQRGKNSITGKYVLDEEKVERWSRQLQEDKAIFGQLTWNFRPESSDIEFIADNPESGHGTLIIRDGTAYLPDSVHRHYAINKAVQSISSGSSFAPDRNFSLRIWRVPEAFEDEIFYAMNMEHDKADATRSKWLAQKNAGQKIAREVVRRSPHLREENVETVTNTLSKKNHRLVAFNTLSSGFEEAWADIDTNDIEKVTEWFLGFWSKLVEVLPQLSRLPLSDRQKSRRESLLGWAISIQGYIRLARRFYDEGLDLALLKKLPGKCEDAQGKPCDFFDWKNQQFQQAGIIGPAVTKGGETRLTARNSHQSRRAMAEVLAARIGLMAKPTSKNLKELTLADL